ncbi:uncharacterized protein LOC114848477 [Betta splendens]|uniref:Uncharacterized protein LOC114848477 n=1 Tax=Betta splendens TaxID=158456 RepID=A0A6P7LLP2_BETSP|nr:uncharacterized protein LOC114848477 [Betta splendens]XP_028994799.1 uncharacterized protein LOC114848477 [Betta splendens]XP_028994802.1 uncharacterized protein LOC114848477 [Betta splendens]XP_028994803.1 uncharacterized protein LOC114848477 [Betta splendens]XP_055361650.1 uncharacterized protein LOC114848477 [Betta splendens]XP_055361651.1 uncharacterized protein LOC114848477 [Betta splendens]
MTSFLQLPAELWLQVFSFLSWKDKLRVRCTCSHFKHLLDKSRLLWDGFSVVLQDFSRYNHSFWRSLAQRQVGRVLVRSGKKKHLAQISSWLPDLSALRLDDWKGGAINELKRFHQLQQLSLTSCSTPLTNLDFLFSLRHNLTQLSLCNVHLTCPAPHLLGAISQLTSLTSLLLHHDGNLKVPALNGVLTHLTKLKHLSWTMITYKILPQDFFRPTHLAGRGGALHLCDLQLLNYDAVVTQEVLQPLSHLQSLSMFHLYSVPGPTCHLQTWLTSLPQLHSLTVYGGHPLAAYVDFLPSTLLSLTLCVDLEPEDLQVVSLRAPHLQHLHLEPWSSSSSLVRLLPQLFPHLTMLRIRHHNVPDSDFLQLQNLQQLDVLEILDSYYRPNPLDPSLVVNKPSPHLLQLIVDFQKMTNHRVKVLTSSHRDLLTCHCV